MFVALWEFEVKPGLEDSFQKIYGPQGSWVQLFRRDPHFRETRLLRDAVHPQVYFTLDYWDSETDYQNFKHNNLDAYESLDRETQNLTLSERHIGCFLHADPAAPTS
jgi:heme-degrading monooxygenase HmoA